MTEQCNIIEMYVEKWYPDFAICLNTGGWKMKRFTKII
jgi:hypothetical protein